MRKSRFEATASILQQDCSKATMHLCAFPPQDTCAVLYWASWMERCKTYKQQAQTNNSTGAVKAATAAAAAHSVLCTAHALLLQVKIQATCSTTITAKAG